MASTAVNATDTGESLSDHQLSVIVKLERTGGSLSLAAVLFIFLAYTLIPRVRNVQNTFIVFASVSNVGASIASIIALDGIRAGEQTALCQAQSFLFEMFMQSDPWWSLAMAINVFLVFYYRASPDSFKKWWWVYCVICYGGPFIIALSLLLVKDSSRGPVYGEATIWCWVDREWDGIRIYTYYMLIWICIAGSFICYFMVGYHVFHSRNHLRSFTTSKSRETGGFHHTRSDLSGTTEGGSYGTVITEVQVVHSSAHSSPRQPESKRTHASVSTGQVSCDENAPSTQPIFSQYYSTVTSSQPSQCKRSPFAWIISSTQSAASKFVVEDPVKRAYLRTSFLFAMSVLITWIPSSMNRIHGWIDGASPFAWHVAAAAVLPLQGFWNAVIFFVTSWSTIKEVVLGRSDKDSEAMDHVRELDFGDRVIRRRSDTDMEDGDSGNMGSDVELRRVSKAQGRRSSSL